MTSVMNAINLLGGIIQILAIIIGINLFGIHNKKTINKFHIMFSIATYIVISALDFYFISIFGDSAGFPVVALYVIKFFIPLLIVFGKINLKIAYFTVLIDFIISFLSNSITCIISNSIKIESVNIFSAVELCVQVLVFALLIFIKKNSNTKKGVIALKIIPISIYILLLLTIICLSALTSLVRFNTDNYKIKENILIVIIIALSVIFAYIIVSLFLNVIAKQHFTAISQMMKNQVELQISHYDEIEKIDVEMRRFRHDYTNHLQSILSLIQMNESKLAEEYIQKLQKVKHESCVIMFYTGNRLADAILANKATMLSKGIQINYSGIISTSIENIDLCTILSNSLDNAIEACCKVEPPCVISIFAGKQQGYFLLSIKNPTVCSENFYNIPTTSKHDKKQHGMGLYNIENAVKKYDGQMKIKCENGVFELFITMKI